MAPNDEDIQEVRAEEERRGKRPLDIAARRRRLALLKKFKEALESDDLEKFTEVLIRDLGQVPGTPEFAQSLKIWNDFHDPSS